MSPAVLTFSLAGASIGLSLPVACGGQSSARVAMAEWFDPLRCAGALFLVLVLVDAAHRLAAAPADRLRPATSVRSREGFASIDEVTAVMLLIGLQLGPPSTGDGAAGMIARG